MAALIPVSDAASALRPCDHGGMEKPNRAERRKNKFGGGRATEHGGWPTHLPNPVFSGDAPPEDVPAAKPTPRKPSTKAAAKPIAANDAPAAGDSGKGDPAKA